MRNVIDAVDFCDAVDNIAGLYFRSCIFSSSAAACEAQCFARRRSAERNATSRQRSSVRLARSSTFMHSSVRPSASVIARASISRGADRQKRPNRAARSRNTPVLIAVRLSVRESMNRRRAIYKYIRRRRESATCRTQQQWYFTRAHYRERPVCRLLHIIFRTRATVCNKYHIIITPRTAR